MSYVIKKEILNAIIKAPELPGCYIWKDSSGKVLYVGKAKSLKSRLRSYLQDTLPYKMKIMVRKAETLEYITTDNEINAYILEQNLIKTYKPFFNTMLKDDKSYPYLKIAVKDPYPYLEVTRRITHDGSIYLGPYPQAHALRETIKTITTAFPIRQCKKNISKKKSIRPCLKHQIGKCAGPCAGIIDEETYRRTVEEFIEFVSGKTEDLIEKLEKEMMEKARTEDFENAIKIRNRLFALRNLLERQKVMVFERLNADIITLMEEDFLSILSVIFVRNGMIMGEEFLIEAINKEELIYSGLTQIYGNKKEVADTVITIHDEILKSESIIKFFNKQAAITLPRNESEKSLVEFAINKTKIYLKNYIENEGRWLKLSKELKEKLSLKKIPQRIEAFDMSNLSGSDPVGSMVVFIEGKEAKSEYRRFSIKDAPARDDIKMHREVLLRRLSHSEWEPPDLIVIDGTINHLRALVPIIDQFKLEVDMIAISKSSPHDRIWKPTGEIVLPTDDPVFLFIQRIRDEAHRFAISYQRKKRSKSTFN